jgi:hypothetical protein
LCREDPERRQETSTLHPAKNPKRKGFVELICELFGSAPLELGQDGEKVG